MDAEEDPAEEFLPAFYETQAKASHHMLSTMSSLSDVMHTCLSVTAPLESA